MFWKPLVLFISVSLVANGAEKPPNVLFILSDDLGYNDVSWHNPDIKTPNLEKLAKAGIILENNYVQPLCTPTRAALMTGYYPIHTGRQHMFITPQAPLGLYTNFTLMPEFFKKLGYNTHLIGKWHLGHCNEKYLPTSRGFDTFYGYVNGRKDHYNHTIKATVGGGSPGYDFWDQNSADESARGSYSTDLFRQRATEKLQNYIGNESADPFFIYLSFQNPHDPLQVSKHHEEMYAHIESKDRRVYSGMVTAMDDVVGDIIGLLERDKETFDNTIIVFSSDNGGDPEYGANNSPLRGGKGSLLEGGTRAPSFIYAPKFLKSRVSRQLMHVTDWLPTLLTAVGGQSLDLGDIDGLDQWQSLKDESVNAVRQGLLYNIDPIFDNAAIRVGNMKLIVGEPNGWRPPLNEMSGTTIRLFNISSDPNEHFNIADEHPDIVKELMKGINDYRSTMIKPSVADNEASGNPNNFGGFFSTGWCEVNQ